MVAAYLPGGRTGIAPTRAPRPSIDTEGSA